MDFENVLYRREEGLAWITINRPKAMNALNPATIKEMKAALLMAAADGEVKVIILTGSGRAFSAGVDLKALGEAKLDKGTVGTALNSAARELIETIQNVPKVVIAAVNGYCITGALEIMLGCDLAVASDEAKFGDTHTRWGLRPTWGMSARLPRHIGLLKAREMSFTAELITAAEAERAGLVNRVVPAADLTSAVRELGKQIATNSAGSLAAYKDLYNQGMKKTLEEALQFEVDTEYVITDTDERLGEFKKKD